jgi:TP901 family phage tail tape measure protein
MTVSEIVVSVRADTAGFQSGMRVVRTETEAATASMNAAGSVASSATGAMAEGADAAGASFAKLAAGGLLDVSAGITALGAIAVKLASDFDSSMTKIQNNTTMTNAEAQKMRETVLKLGKESGAAFDDLGEGFMHIMNFGFTAAQATTILDSAMKSAVATGAKTADTANVLAAALKEFSIPAQNAGKAMNVMHLAAAMGNMTLQQFNHAAGPAFAMAGNLGVKLTDVSAAFAALTRHGFNATQAATQLRGVMTNIVHPSKQAQDAIAALSRISGIDLVRDFSAAGLHAKGLHGIMLDLNRATQGHVDIIMKRLIPAQRGGIGAMVLAGNGAKDYDTILKQLELTMAGKIDPTTQGFNRTMQTLGQQIEVVKRQIEAEFIPVGEKLIPIFTQLVADVRPLIDLLVRLLDAFTRLPKPVQEAVFAFGAMRIGALLLGRVLGFGGLTGTVVQLLGKIGLIPAAARIAASAMSSIGSMGVGGALGATGIGAIAATAGGLAYMGISYKNQILSEGDAVARAAAGANLTPIMEKIRKTELLLKASPNNTALHSELDKLYGFARNMAGLNRHGTSTHANPSASVTSGGYGAGGSDLDAQIGAESKRYKDAMKQQAADAKSAAKEYQQAEQERVTATKRANDEIFRLTHTELQVKIREAKQEEAEDIKSGVSKTLAHKRYLLTVQEAEKEAAEKVKAEQDKVTAANKKAFEARAKEVHKFGDLLAKAFADDKAQKLQRALAFLSSEFRIQEKTVEEQAKRQAEADKAAEESAKQQSEELRKLAEARQKLTDRITEGLADSKGKYDQERLELNKLGETYGHATSLAVAYERVIGRLNLASKDLTDEQKQQVMAIAQVDVEFVKLQQKRAMIEQFTDGVRNSIHGMFDNLLSGGKNFFGSLIQGFTQMLQRMASDFLSSQFYNLFLRNFGGILGGGGTPGIAAPASGGLGNLGGAIGGLFAGAFAGGGSMRAGQVALVGERGPELFIPNTSGSIVSNSQLSSGGMGGVNITMNISTPDANSFRQSQSQVMQDMWRNVNAAQKRNK